MKTFSENWTVSPHLHEVELVYRTDSGLSSKPQLQSPSDVHSYLLSIWNMDKVELQEEFYVILLNNAMRVLGWCKISTGGKSATIVDVSHVVQVAVLGNASSIILAHNHPSGKLIPSSSDINLTERIQKSLRPLSISVNDHIIISRQGFYSFLDHNKMPENRRSNG